MGRLADDTTTWACDVPVSMPQPVDNGDIRLDMGSHAFTEFGLVINISIADVQQIAMPTYAPVEPV